MDRLTINDFVNFFRSLELKRKIELLNELTSVLNSGMKEEALTEVIDEDAKPEDELVDELFGIWKDEDELTEATIINRTVSDREIDLD